MLSRCLLKCRNDAGCNEVDHIFVVARVGAPCHVLRRLSLERMAQCLHIGGAGLHVRARIWFLADLILNEISPAPTITVLLCNLHFTPSSISFHSLLKPPVRLDPVKKGEARRKKGKRKKYQRKSFRSQ